MTNAIKVTKVVVNRAEGLITECGVREFKSIQAAEAFLRQAARTAPATGGYDKCDFEVHFSDGESYAGRIDLQREHTAGYSIAAHISDFLTFMAGDRRPGHMTPETYARVVKQYNMDRDAVRAFLAKYMPVLSSQPVVEESAMEYFIRMQE